MGAWIVDNIFSIISLAVMIVGFIAATVKLSEHFKSDIKRHDEEITELKVALEKEKEQNKQNYIKQESKIEECINLISAKFDESIQALNARIDKIDEIKSDITSMKKDIEYMKEDLNFLKKKNEN